MKVRADGYAESAVLREFREVSRDVLFLAAANDFDGVTARGLEVLGKAPQARARQPVLGRVCQHCSAAGGTNR